MELYWYLVLSNLRENIGFLSGFVEFIFFGGYLIFFIIELDQSNTEQEKKDYGKAKKICRNIALIALSIIFLIQFIPTKKDLAIMFAWDGLKSDTVAEVVELLKEKIR